MSLLKTGNNRVGELTTEERAVLWLHKHYPNIEAVDLDAASKPPTQYIFPDYVCVHIINSWNLVEGKIYTKKNVTTFNPINRPRICVPGQKLYSISKYVKRPTTNIK